MHTLAPATGHLTVQRALILEDQADSREWLSGVLTEAFPGLGLCACRTLAEARARFEAFHPQIALVDLGLPDGSGLDFIADLQQHLPTCLSVVTTIYGDDAHLFPALRAGARGYLLKEQSQQQLVAVLRRIADGEPPLSPAIARRLLGIFTPMPVAAGDELASREREVLSLIAKGYKLSEVAASLGIAQDTAATHVKNIYRKLHITNRAEAALEAARLGLVRSLL